VHIWTLENWKYNFTNIQSRRSGLRFRFTPDVNTEVRGACLKFGKWLRKEYFFPIRVPVYVKGKKYIKAMDGDMVLFFNHITRHMSHIYVWQLGVIQTIR